MADAPLPARLGRYDIVERLASGGMGEVFLARYLGPGGFVKPVAVKRIHRHLASDEAFIHMLLDEGRVASALEHPNIVATLDVGCDAGEYFVATQYVCGDPLSRVVRELRRQHRRAPPWLVAWVGACIASALHGAHEARALDGAPLGIVHRDVSPANILLADTGHPMLLDFGVAKATQRMHQTTNGELKGKLPYMAPEVLQGFTAERSVDVYGLGVTLYELATCVSSFSRSSDADTIIALQAGACRPARAIAPEIPPELEDIIAQAMAPERSARHADAAELEHDLHSWARRAGAPHDAASAAEWLAETLPDATLARRRMLARAAAFVPAPTGRDREDDGGATSSPTAVTRGPAPARRAPGPEDAPPPGPPASGVDAAPARAATLDETSTALIATVLAAARTPAAPSTTPTVLSTRAPARDPRDDGAAGRGWAVARAAAPLLVVAVVGTAVGAVGARSLRAALGRPTPALAPPTRATDAGAGATSPVGGDVARTPPTE